MTSPLRTRRVLVVLGTRPEAIKLAPVVLALRARPAFEVHVCATGQHADLVTRALAPFGVSVDHALDVMRHGQSLGALTARLLDALEPLVAEVRPDWIVVQGDTTTTFAASLVGFYERIPVAHVEAGLRSGDRDAPFPEELNRRVSDLVASVWFAPTERAARALAAEGADPARIHVTGNTGIDALKCVLERSTEVPDVLRELPADARWVLVTAHRRENLGPPLEGICAAVREIASRHGPRVHIVWPVHPNPEVGHVVTETLGSVPHVTLLPPLDYASTAALLARAHLVLTDSGGLQEEAPSLGIPVLVLRDVTERPEAVESGNACVVGCDPARIAKEADRLLLDDAEHARMARPTHAFGDGRAAERIADHLSRPEETCP